MKKLGNALAIHSVLGAIVDIHGEQKHDHIHDDNEGNEQGNPPLLRLFREIQGHTRVLNRVYIFPAPG